MTRINYFGVHLWKIKSFLRGTFWIEANGKKCIEIAYSNLTTKENEALMKAIDNNWDFINKQIDKTFAGEKTTSKKLK